MVVPSTSAALSTTATYLAVQPCSRPAHSSSQQVVSLSFLTVQPSHSLRTFDTVVDSRFTLSHSVSQQRSREAVLAAQPYSCPLFFHLLAQLLFSCPTLPPTTYVASQSCSSPLCPSQQRRRAAVLTAVLL